QCDRPLRRNAGHPAPRRRRRPRIRNLRPPGRPNQADAAIMPAFRRPPGGSRFPVPDKPSTRNRSPDRESLARVNTDQDTDLAEIIGPESILVETETVETAAAETVDAPDPAIAEISEAPVVGSHLAELRRQGMKLGSQQSEMPFAIVQGKPITEMPKGLYIPPEALEVTLEAFEGPLELLLYLIRRQNIDILEINVAAITEQYMRYVNMMSAMQFELAAEYLLMAAMLAEIKSRMLLPRSSDAEEEEEDPRAQLIRRLQEYERFKKAAEDIEELPRVGRDIHIAPAALPDLNKTRPEPHVDLKELMVALADVLRRADM